MKRSHTGDAPHRQQRSHTSGQTTVRIEANRIYTEGKGEKQPVADNKTRDGRAKNRRVEIEVVGTRPVR